MKGIVIVVLATVLCNIMVLAGTDAPWQEEHRIRLKEFSDMDNHTGILNYIDSLRSMGLEAEEFSWLYANTLFQSGRLDQARDSLKRWEDDSLFSSRAINLLTQIAIQQRDYMDAVKYLVRLREMYPTSSVYPHRLARVFHAMNQLPAAEGYYSKAHQLDTLNQIIIGEWVDVLIKLDFGARARRVLKKGITASPENLGFRRQKVTLTYRECDYLQTLDNAAFLTHRGDTTPQIVKIKGFALFHLDSLDRAEFWMDYLIDNGFVGEDVYYYKGRILAARNQKAEAQPYFHLASISCLSANFNSFSLAAGINLYETQQYQESIRWLQMMRHFSQNPMIIFYLALNFYDYYEDKNPALTHFRLFLEHSHSEAQESHREFATRKIREIVEEMHFKGYNP
jgi:predicted Zn-dependent protease